MKKIVFPTLKSIIAFIISAGVLLGGQWVSAGNIPGWGGQTTTNQPQVQQPREPLVSEPAPVPAPTVQLPSSWSPPRSTSEPASSPTGSTPAQQPNSYKPTTRSRTVPSPVLPQTGGGAVGVSPPRQGSTSPSAGTGTTRQDVPGKKARFRITLNGFRIFAQKGVLPRRGHSYYIAAKVLKYSQWGAILSNITVATRIIGHTNKFPGAIKGGTATNNGGFRNGDVYPTSVPYAASGAYSDKLPLLVWEGELEEGGDVVVVEPTIWEKRNGVDIFRVWREYVPPNIGDLYPCFPRHWDLTGELYNVPVPEWTEQHPAPLDDLISGPSPPGYVEPGIQRLKESSRICTEITPKALFRPTGRNEPDVIAGLTEKTFYLSDDPYEVTTNVSYPYGILLNYSMAEKMANETQTGPVYAVQYYSNGIPPGFISKNERRETSLPEGGIQVSMFSRIPRDLKTMKISGANSAFVIPDWTVIELYVQVRRL